MVIALRRHIHCPKTKRGCLKDNLFVLVAEAGLEPHDLRVMSPASYQLLHSAILSHALTKGINGARDRT